MPKGSCLCGAIAYEFTGEPAMKAACHCRPCQKTSGNSASVNLMVPKDNFQLTKGSPKEYIRKGDSGQDVIYRFCPDCPTIITVDATVLGSLYIIKYGTLDDYEYIDQNPPAAEIFCKNRWEWVKPLGVAEKEAQ